MTTWFLSPLSTKLLSLSSPSSSRSGAGASGKEKKRNCFCSFHHDHNPLHRCPAPLRLWPKTIDKLVNVFLQSPCVNNRSAQKAERMEFEKLVTVLTSLRGLIDVYCTTYKTTRPEKKKSFKEHDVTSRFNLHF